MHGAEPQFQIGDRVIYRKSKIGTHPTPRAIDVRPTRQGEAYHYLVEKYWVVLAVEPDGTLELGTRRGKRHRLAPGTPGLKRATWWQRWWHNDRFPSLEEMDQFRAEDGGNTSRSSGGAPLSGSSLV